MTTNCKILTIRAATLKMEDKEFADEDFHGISWKHRRAYKGNNTKNCICMDVDTYIQMFLKN